MPPLLLCPLPALSRPPGNATFRALRAPLDPRFSPLDVERNAATLAGPNSRVAQLVEQAAVNRRVPGSSPGSGAVLHESWLWSRCNRRSGVGVRRPIEPPPPLGG